jgi:hypothetical protein
MTTRLPALPALVAARALREEATAAARRSLDQVRDLLSCYDLALAVARDLPPSAREVLVDALHGRLVATEGAAQACQARLEEVGRFCDRLRAIPRPNAMVEVPAPLFEMISPYLDDAMEPVIAAISRRAGPGCSAEAVGRYFAQPAIAA